MRLSMKILVATIMEFFVVLFLLPYVKDPLPLLIIATVGWPALMLTVVVLDERWRATAGSFDMIKLRNYQNLDAIRQDVSQLAHHRHHVEHIRKY